MTDSKKSLSIRVPGDIYDSISSQASETGLSITDVSIALLAAALGRPVPTPGDRLTAVEKELATVQKKLKALASN